METDESVKNKVAAILDDGGFDYEIYEFPNGGYEFTVERKSYIPEGSISISASGHVTTDWHYKGRIIAKLKAV